MAVGGFGGRAGASFQKSFLSQISSKMNFDHLSLFDRAHKHYTKLTAMLQSKQDVCYQKMAFSDYMYHYNSKQRKQRVIIMITDKAFYMLHATNFSLIKDCKLQALNAIISISSNSSILALKFRQPRAYVSKVADISQNVK